MRLKAFLILGVACAALAARAEAQVRNSAGNPPGLRTQQDTATAPPASVLPPANSAQGSQAFVPPHYSVETDGPSAAPTVPVQAAPLMRGDQPVVASHPVYSAGDPNPPPPPPPALRPSVPATPVEHVVVSGTRGYLLGPGDKVHVTVYGETDLTGDFEISTAGRLAFPLIGEVQAAGLTAVQLGERLSEKLAGGYLINPRVAVEVATYRPFYVLGQVTKPGGYPYAGGLTINRAIALAGGFTPQAVEGTVYIRHEGQVHEHEYALDDVPEIEPGDVIRVEESTFWTVVSAMQPLAIIAGVIRSGVP